jgi:hypothetical protein
MYPALDPEGLRVWIVHDNILSRNVHPVGILQGVDVLDLLPLFGTDRNIAWYRALVYTACPTAPGCEQGEECFLIAAVDVLPETVDIVGEAFPVPEDVSTGNLFVTDPDHRIVRVT